jgi:hypothetical protein
MIPSVVATVSKLHANGTVTSSSDGLTTLSPSSDTPCTAIATITDSDRISW